MNTVMYHIAKESTLWPTHGGPNVTSLLGDTPGSLGKNDHADPTMNLIFQTFEETAGTIVQTADGISVSVGTAADSVKEWAVKTDKEAAYQFFATFFDHYLPKKFLNHYVYKKGDALTLTQQEMIDCNPAISLERSRDFNKLLQELSRAHAKCLIEPDIRPIDIRLIAAALTNGTLGQFTVKMKGNIEYRSASDWKIYIREYI
ncbi:MAG: hypothetical protein PHF56_13095 [Desulfuromonadaceae bacterium]|nr:hypothetical protein [Desulfuromonadaceae bacterium]